MKGGIGDGGTRQPDSPDHRLGRQYARTAHLDHNILHHRGLDLRRIFVGRCPPGELGGGTQPFPLDPLEEDMATHSSILAWRISWTEEPERLQSMGWQRVRDN